MQDYTDFLGQVLHTGTNAPVGAVTPSTTPFSVEGPPKPSGNALPSISDFVGGALGVIGTPITCLFGGSCDPVNNAKSAAGAASGVTGTVSLLTDLPRMGTIFIGAVLIVAALIGLTRSSGV
jgi:hypothetical protein